MSIHVYRRAVVVADATRALGGLVLAGLPLIAGGMPTGTAALLALVSIVFAAYALASFNRALSQVEISARGISVRGPWPARLAWSDLERVRLAYYSTRRDGRAGWVQLSLVGARRRIVIDSRISDFAAVARYAAGAAERRALRLDPATLANLRGLGIAAGVGADRATMTCSAGASS